jgi:hypothetical protein
MIGAFACRRPCAGNTFWWRERPDTLPVGHADHVGDFSAECGLVTASSVRVAIPAALSRSHRRPAAGPGAAGRRAVTRTRSKEPHVLERRR